MSISLGRLAVLLLVLAEAVGGLTLRRIGYVAGSELVGSVRLWVVVAFVLSVLLLRSRSPAPHAPSLRIGWWVAVLHAVLLLTLWWAPPVALDTTEILGIILIIIAMPAAGWVFAKDTDALQRWMLRLLYVMGLIILPVALVAFSDVASELNLRAVGSIRISRTAGLGIVAALALAVELGPWPWLIPVPFWVLVMATSGNRASLLALAFGALPVLFATRKVRVLSGTAVMGVIGGVLVVLVPLAGEIVRFFLFEALWEPGGGIYVADRGILFGSAVRLFREAPFLGHGLGGYAALAGNYYEYPHNLTLSFASEMGLLGLIPYFVILWTTLKAFAERRSPIHLGMAGVFVYLWVASQFSGTFGDAFLMWVAALAICGALRPPEESSRVSGAGP